MIRRLRPEARAVSSFEKSSPPEMAPMIGMIMSPTKEFIIAPNAAPMMTPTARSTTLPRKANFFEFVEHGRVPKGLAD